MIRKFFQKRAELRKKQRMLEGYNMASEMLFNGHPEYYLEDFVLKSKVRCDYDEFDQGIEQAIKEAKERRKMTESTVCLICEDDYEDIAEECFVAGVCPDCRDIDCLEDLFEDLMSKDDFE